MLTGPRSATYGPGYGATIRFPVDSRHRRYFRAPTAAPAINLRGVFPGRGACLAMPGTQDFRMTSSIRRLVRLDLRRHAQLARPKRPQDRIEIGQPPARFSGSFYSAPAAMASTSRRSAGRARSCYRRWREHQQWRRADRRHRHTSTSNPSVLLAAGLLAKKAVRAGPR